MKLEAYRTKLGLRHLWGLLWLIPLLLAQTMWQAVWMAVIVSGIFWLRTIFVRPKKNLDVVRRIQDDLHLDFAYFRYKPSDKKSIIGGFMIPILPFIAFVRSKKRFIEASIHEHYHMWWMIYGFQTAVAFAFIAIAGYLPFPWSYVAAGICVLAWMIFNEYLAFTSTKAYAEARGFKGIRSFDLGIVKKYAVFYGSVITVFILLRPLKQIRWSFYMLCLIGAVLLLGKLWYYAFEKWGWLKKQEELDG